MANRYLLPAYQKLYDESFDYSDFDMRMKMQKAIYLLQDMGVPVGDYGFHWYFHGPYSQELQDDMHEENRKRTSDDRILERYGQLFDQLYNAIHDEAGKVYGIARWMECIASIHYLLDNIMDFDSTMEDVLKELMKRKDHLADRSANEVAYRIVEELYGV